MNLRLLALGLWLASSVAVAQNMKPGLWEITTTMQSGGKDMGAAMAAMQQQMAAMKPEQRKMMEEMMAKKGVQMGAPSGGGMSVKMCMTQAMIERNQVTQAQPGCTHNVTPRTGNTMKFSFSCIKPPSSGQGEVTYTSPEAYSMKMASTSTVAGKDHGMEMQASGRWLGSDCGVIKPIVLPAQ